MTVNFFFFDEVIQGTKRNSPCAGWRFLLRKSVIRKRLETTGVTAYDMLTKEPERMEFR